MRLTLVAPLFIVSVIAMTAHAGEPNAPAAVDFVMAEGSTCLQPVAQAGAKLEDYRAAEQRWLAKEYPGAPARRWQTVLVVVPNPTKDDETERVTVQRETAHLDNGATVCFEIMLEERSARPK